jgi:hypothetical protein
MHGVAAHGSSGQTFASWRRSASRVSREQARILWAAESTEYRLLTEPGASGTRILRDGRTIDVSAQDRRGVRLLSGDEIYLGKACLKVAIRAGEG